MLRPRRLYQLLFTIRHKLSSKGQVAVILILVVAAALIFYAASLNLGRMSQTKVLTTVAADTGASLLASYMASYGQSLWRTSLRSDGDGEICKWTGVIGAIVAVVIAIIVIVVAIFTGGVGAVPLLAWLSLALSVLALTIQLTYIQPGLTSAWNRQIFDLMSLRDAVVEQGIQTALRASITDSVQVPDLHDLDTDRIWGLDELGMPRDTISRFGFYNDRRRIQEIHVLSSLSISNFRNALDEFLNKKSDGWGLYEKTACSTVECNPCCVPPSEWTESMGCGDPQNTIDVYKMLEICKNASPYGSNYPWVYDAYRGDPSNTFNSFQEQLGRDDEHKGFEKDSNNPNGLQSSIAPNSFFQLDDTTDYYPTDNRQGVFGFFYKIADWGMGLEELLCDDPNNPSKDPDNPKCHWRDKVYGGITCSANIEHPTQLSLPLDPTTLTLTYNKTYCVDGENPTPGYPPLVADLVQLSVDDKIVAADNECAQEARYTQKGFWKRGGDRFCSPGDANGNDSSWPYYAQCPAKFGNNLELSCGTGGTDAKQSSPENWPDDLLDNVNYGLNLFVDWALEFLKHDETTLTADFWSWYPNAAEWIEPGKSSEPYGSNASNFLQQGSVSCGGDIPVPCCYLCQENDGTLHVWWKDIKMMLERLKLWRDHSFAGTQCREAWCVPPENDLTCPGWFSPSAAEQATFDSNGNGTRGDMQDIIACLNWNINDTITTNGVTAIGNAQKFQGCYTACQDVNDSVNGVNNNVNLAQRAQDANTLCSGLPRSLVPNFDTALFVKTNVTASPPVMGSCGNSFFMSDLQQSGLEAENQVAKFRARHAFLKGRLDELNTLIKVLEDAEAKFSKFLSCPDGPACELIKDRIEFDKKKSGLAYHAIYGWQDKPNQECVENCADEDCKMRCGRWHIVRADARIPERCDSACGDSQTVGSDPGWPKISTREKHSGTKRCYFLDNRQGVVKMRVTRYDQPPKSMPILFPNAVEIWRPSFGRSDRPSKDTVDPFKLAEECKLKMVPNPGEDRVNSKNDYYYGAFMLEEREEGSDDPCWDLANNLLAQGITSEACARYYFQNGSGMDFKFVPCQNF